MRDMGDGEYLVFSTKRTKVKAVFKREFDNLTPEEIKKFANLVADAKLGKLKRWQNLKCFRRLKRTLMKNRVDGTLVLKWKRSDTATIG